MIKGFCVSTIVERFMKFGLVAGIYALWRRAQIQLTKYGIIIGLTKFLKLLV